MDRDVTDHVGRNGSSGITPPLTDEERDIITQAIVLGCQALGNVRTWLLVGNVVMTNYVPFRRYFHTHAWTDACGDFAAQVWESITGDSP